MKAKKIAALTLTALMAAASMTGCSESGTSSGPSTGSNAGNSSQSSASTAAASADDYGLKEFVMVMIPGEDTEKSVQLRDNMAEDMSKALGIPVTTYRATDYSAAVEAMRTGNAQLAEFGPFSYVTARERAGAEALAVRGTTDGVSGYQSYIVVKSDSGLHTLEDLQGKTFSFVDPESTSGNVVPCNELLNAFPDLGLTFDDLHTDGKFFKSAMFAGTHPGSMQAVIQGNVDAGAVASSTYENQIQAGNAKEDDLKILHESPTIPSDPIAIQKDLPQALKDKVKEFLLSYDDADYFSDAERIEEGKEIQRFIEANDSDYDYLQELKEKFNLSD